MEWEDNQPRIELLAFNPNPPRHHVIQSHCQRFQKSQDILTLSTSLSPHHRRQRNMRPLTEEETKAVFESEPNRSDLAKSFSDKYC